jgi:hypothetical protein
MNERIRELAKQHGLDITIDGMGYGEGNIEGLAELIVRECADIADIAEPYKANDLILKHFGVEE